MELAINNRSDNQILSTKPGREESLWCTVHNSSRAEELRWYRDSGTVNMKDGNKINTTNICILPVSKTDNGVSFTCKLVRNESIQISVTLDVQCELMGGLIMQNSYGSVRSVGLAHPGAAH